MAETTLVPIPQSDLVRVTELAGLAIQDAAGEQRVVEGLLFIKSVRRALEKARKELVEPLNTKIKEVNASFKPLSDSVEHAEEKISGVLLSWRKAEAERIRLEQERVARENAEREARAREDETRRRREVKETTHRDAEAAGFKPEEAAELAELEAASVPQVQALQEVAPSTPAATVRSSIGTATVRKVWTFELTDQQLVPRAYLSVNEPAIREAVRAGVREIPGVRIYQDEQLAGRTR